MAVSAAAIVALILFLKLLMSTGICTEFFKYPHRKTSQGVKSDDMDSQEIGPT
jgi:hypothetical protein